MTLGGVAFTSEGGSVNAPRMTSRNLAKRFTIWLSRKAGRDDYGRSAHERRVGESERGC